MAEKSKLPIYASIAANVAIAATKFVAAALSGSSAMIAEGVHSTVDAGDGLLLLLGRSRARKPPDDQHPLGHGQELYFWTFMVAIVFFAIGGGMSIYEGIGHILRPEPVRDPTLNYIVLGVAAAFDGTSWVIAVRNFLKQRQGRGPIAAMLASKDPSVFSVVLEDSADLAGILLAFLGVFLSVQLGLPVLDGVASIGVGLVLATVAVFLAVQSKGLLVGERADQRILDRIAAVVSDDPEVRAFQRPVTMHLGPEDVLLALGIEFRQSLSAGELSRTIERLEDRIRQAVPSIRHIYVESQSLGGRGRANR